jgi:DNA-binding NarL/FixJ family response regulator
MPTAHRLPKSLPHLVAVRPVDQLIRELVANAAPADSNASGDQVLLEHTVGAVQYLLVRRSLVEPADSGLLSPRELEISRLVAKGYVNKTIAGVLEISYYTVDTYLRRIFAKLNVTSRAAMVARLSEEGYLTEASPLDAPNHAAKTA